MTAHARAARAASAAAAYGRMRQQLLDELEKKPSEPTRALYLSILHGEERVEKGPAPPATSKGPSLPGRAKELESLDRAYAMSTGNVYLAGVEGEAGIGKTHLLLAWTDAQRQAGTTILWGTCDPLGTALPLQALLDALHVYLSRASGDEVRALRSAAGPVLGPLLGAEDGEAGAAPDPLSAPGLLYAGVLEVCQRVGGKSPAILVVDDVHLADPSTLAWLNFATKRSDTGGLLIVAAGRSEGDFAPRTGTKIQLGPLDLDAATELVGPDLAKRLHERSGGHPLFLLELARTQGPELPETIVQAVAQQSDRTGPAAVTLRTAAVLGPQIDLDLLAGILRRPAVELLSDLERGEQYGLFEEKGAQFVFRHELVREALVAGTGASRRALVHRDAARQLAGRRDRDPALLTIHARQGGELALAASALIEAAAIASDRFDHVEAERLLDESLVLDPTPDGSWPERESV